MKASYIHAGICACLGLAIQLFFSQPTTQRCQSLMRVGHWVWPSHSNQLSQWQPNDVLSPVWAFGALERCFGNKTIFFVGDSIARSMFKTFAHKIDPTATQEPWQTAGKHSDIDFNHDNIGLHYLWDPFLNRTCFATLIQQTTNASAPYIFLSTGLWHAQYTDANAFVQPLAQALASAAATDISASHPRTPLIFLPPPHLDYGRLDERRRQKLTRENLVAINHLLAALERSMSTAEVAWSTRLMTLENPHALEEDGIHVTSNLAHSQMSVLLHRACSHIYHGSNKASSLACVNEHKDLALSSSFMLLAVILIIHRLGVDTSQSSTEALASLFVVLSYCFAADRTHIFSKCPKVTSQSLFGSMTAISLFLMIVLPIFTSAAALKPSAFPRKPLDLDAILPRTFTDEWKGWMQVVILWYHYFGMSKVLWIYKTARVLVAAYLFLTGYGHATHFLKTADFGLRRVFGTLLRINTLTCLLAFTMGNGYDFYYFPMIVSFWYLTCYGTFAIGAKIGLGKQGHIALILFLVSTTKIAIEWPSTIQTVFNVLEVFHGPKFELSEFLFRLKLDLFAPSWGMLLGILQGETTFRSWISPRYGCQRGLRVGTSLALAIFTATLWIYLTATCVSKHDCNKKHAYTSILPITSYILTRRALFEWKSSYSLVLAYFGRCSLELYILQYHIWLAGDSTGLLRLGRWSQVAHLPQNAFLAHSSFYWLESGIVTVIFVLLSICCTQSIQILVTQLLDCSQQTLAKRAMAIVMILWLTNLLISQCFGNLGHLAV